MRLIRFLDNEDKKIKYCTSENGSNYFENEILFFLEIFTNVY